MTTSPSQDGGRSARPAAGDILAGKYRIERMIGAGGMGCVLAAEHLQLGQRVAIKTLLPDALKHAEAVKRFELEARAAVRLRTEHVGRVIDVGTLESGAPYMVMEYLEGQDLASEIRDRGCLPVSEAADYVLQACEAVAEAHSYGMVHRDLKPANLFLTRRPDGSPLIKVLDFGISKAAPEDQGFQLTRTNTVMGSPGYMSPEQLRSTKDVDARSDIWALGIILYELVSGTQPFRADSFAALCIKVATEPAPGLSVAGLPAGFQAIVTRCLAKDPGERYADVAELAQALAAFASAESKTFATRVGRVLRSRPGSGMGSRQAVPSGVITSGMTATDEDEDGDHNSHSRGRSSEAAATPPTTIASSPGMDAVAIPNAAALAKAAAAPARAAVLPVTTMAGATGQASAADSLIRRTPWMAIAGALMAAAVVSAVAILMTRAPGDAADTGAPAEQALAQPASPPDAAAAVNDLQAVAPADQGQGAALPGTNAVQGKGADAGPDTDKGAQAAASAAAGASGAAEESEAGDKGRAGRRSRRDRDKDKEQPGGTDPAQAGSTPVPGQGTGTNTSQDPDTKETPTKDLYDTRY